MSARVHPGVRMKGSAPALLALIVLAVVPAAAQAPAMILHEPVPPPPATGTRVVDPTEGPGQPGSGPPVNPAAVRLGSRLLPAPSGSLAAAPGEPVHGRGGFAVDRDTRARPDYATAADGALRYVEVFNPSVVPFKRMTSLDAVGPDYELRVRDARRTELAVGGAVVPDRDVFWGSLLVELWPGEDVPIPSVAPDMRVLSYEVVPRSPLVFLRDQADNYFVRAGDATAGGTHRLVFLADAPAAYFASSVPGSYTLAEARARSPATPLAARAQAAADQVLRSLGISGATPLNAAVDALVGHFRGFEPGPPPRPTGDVYLDLATSRRGACRHRAFAFVVTAAAAGIPARYVANEAHAFVEIWVPERAWLRVDLGGAALELDVANASDKAIHRPRADDPFPRPGPYAAVGYTRLAGEIRGLSPVELDAARADTTGGPQAAPGDSPFLPEPGHNGRAVREIAIDAASASGFRGEPVQVTGHVSPPTPGLHVDVYLAPPGGGIDDGRSLGRTTTDARGHFELRARLPFDLDVGAYQIFAATPGDDTWAPATSR